MNVKYLRVYVPGEPIAVADVEFRHNTFPELDDIVSSQAVGEALIASNVKFDVGVPYNIVVSKDEKPSTDEAGG